MKTVWVNTVNNHYPIEIAPHLMQNTAAFGQVFNRFAQAVVITDENVRKLYGRQLVNQLRQNGLQTELLSVPPGEPSKSMNQVGKLFTRLIERQITRQAVIVALGGGVVGDLAGFVAATYLRGVNLIQVPTTLLAQVDSSVGGKVGINHRLGKNLIGSFYQPQHVLIDPYVLQTLEMRERRAGAAEVIKYGLIADSGLFAQLETSLEALLDLTDIDFVANVIEQCCRIKADIVGQDEREQSFRALLNFGHTVGHALENATQYRVFLHGEAVAYGMLAALHLSIDSLCSTSLERAIQLIRRLSLPPIPQSITVDQLLSAMQQDKKRRQSGQTWILLKSIGSAFMSENLPEIRVRQVLNDVLLARRVKK